MQHVEGLAGSNFLRLLGTAQADLTGRLGHGLIGEALRFCHIDVKWYRSRPLHSGHELIAHRVQGERRRRSCGAQGERQLGAK